MGEQKDVKAETQEQTTAVAKTSINVGMVNGGLVPRDLDQLWRVATLMHRSGMMPKAINCPEAVAVAVQMGLEVGLSPMAAVQNIAVINGRPSIWGDAALGLVQASPLCEDVQEIPLRDPKTNEVIGYRCRVKRKGREAYTEQEFTLTDARTAGLLAKDGPWKQYPKRMLQMRARSWALRDAFPDVLKGLRMAEEQMDVIEAEATVVTPRSALTAGRHEAPKRQRVTATIEDHAPGAGDAHSAAPSGSAPAAAGVNTDTGEVEEPPTVEESEARRASESAQPPDGALASSDDPQPEPFDRAAALDAIGGIMDGWDERGEEAKHNALRPVLFGMKLTANNYIKKATDDQVKAILWRVKEIEGGK